MGGKIAIQTTRLAKSFGGNEVIKDCSMCIREGTIYGFLGANGAGKTTMFKLLTGLLTPDFGDVEILGENMLQYRDKMLSQIGSLIEAPTFYEHLSAYKNLEIHSEYMGVEGFGVDKALKMVGLSDTQEKASSKFSLGMRQRLGIARAIIHKPKILILDEPINGLDPQGIAEVRDTIQNLCAQQDMTVFISSHILEELSKLATDYGIINNGALLQEITREELLSKCSEKITLTVDNPNKAVPVLDKMGFVHYMIVDKNHIDVYERLNDSAALNTALVTAGVSVAQLAVTGMELETYFLSITGGATNV